MKKDVIMNRLIAKTDFLVDSLPAQPLIELCGENRVYIENHLGICQYGTEQIIVRVRLGSVCISGVSLRLCKMTDHQLVIAGKIQGIELLKG